MAKNMLVGAKILKVNLRRSKLSRELFHVVSYCVILKMAGNKKDLHRTSGTSEI